MINYSQEFIKVAAGSMLIISKEGGGLKLILEFKFQTRKKNVWVNSEKLPK